MKVWWKLEPGSFPSKQFDIFFLIFRQWSVKYNEESLKPIFYNNSLYFFTSYSNNVTDSLFNTFIAFYSKYFYLSTNAIKFSIQIKGHIKFSIDI